MTSKNWLTNAEYKRRTVLYQYQTGPVLVSAGETLDKNKTSFHKKMKIKINEINYSMNKKLPKLEFSKYIININVKYLQFNN